MELDKKGSEMDTLMKEEAAVRAELKEMKGMFNAAEAGAGAAGADEDSLRKRLSQLMCENGLLKGEKDRLEALAVSAAAEAKSSLSRSAVDIEGLEREVEQLRERAEKASRRAADGDRAKVAVGVMEAKLSELRQERTDLQVFFVFHASSSRLTLLPPHSSSRPPSNPTPFPIPPFSFYTPPAHTRPHLNAHALSLSGS